MKEKSRILICEGSEKFGILLKEYLEQKGYEVKFCYDGLSGNHAFMDKKYDLCIIDVKLPEMDGFSLAKEMKKYRPGFPIIFLVDRTDHVRENVIIGLKMGADDFFIKPYDFEILSYRINSILNRSVQKEKPEPKKYAIGDFTYNQHDNSLSNSSLKIRLTTKESALLRLLCLNMNNLLTREDALKEVWGRADYFTAKSMDVYITKLRKLFKEYPNIEIMNIHGKGYKLMCNTLVG